MIPAQLAAVDPGSWHVQDARPNKQGKSAAIRGSAGTPEVVLTSVDAPLRCPFQPSAYQDDAAKRLNMVFCLDDAAQAGLQRIDEWAMEFCARPENLQRFWPGKSKEDVLRMYKPLVTINQHGASTKAKLNTQ